LTCRGNGPRCDEGAGPYLLPQLKNASTINRVAVSIYLGPNQPNETNSEIIFGAAYDKAKIEGTLFTVKMVDPFNSSLTGDSTNLVNVTSIEADIAGKHAKQTYGSGSINEGLPYTLDTGNSHWYMPPSVYNLAAPALGITNTTEMVNFVYPVDCKYKDPKNAPGHLTVRFGHAGKIEVPLHELVTSFGNGSCNAAIASGSAESANLGDPFLRSGYFIFDQEAFTVTMGQAKHTAKRDVVSYPNSGFKVAVDA
jgi:candidapepsin